MERAPAETALENRGTSMGTYIFDELEEQIYLSGTGLCVHSLTALLRVVGLWLFLRLGLCV